MTSEFHLRRSFGTYFMRIGGLMFIILMAWTLLLTTQHSTLETREVIAMCVGILIMALDCFQHVRIPTTICVDPVGAVVLSGPFRHTVLPPGTVRSLKPRFGDTSLYLKHTRGSILLLRAYSDFDRLLEELNAANPQMEISAELLQDSVGVQV